MKLKRDRVIEEVALREELDEVYSKYKATVNMSASELETWSENACSKKASVSRAPIKRNLELLRTKKENWTSKHIRWANRTISFVNRMKGAEQGEPAAEGCPSKRDISLKNWAYDPSKGSKKSILDIKANYFLDQSDAIDRLRSSIQNFIPLKVENAIADDSQENNDDQLDFHLGEPTTRQLELINAQLGYESKASDWFVCSFHASNTLLDLDLRAWHESSLYQMALDATGKVILTDHSWESVSTAQGFIYQALLVRDSEVDPYMLSGAGHEEYNKEIIEMNGGMLWLYLAACMPKNSEAAEAIKTRRFQSSSTGTILHKPYFICPDCTKEYRIKHSGSKYSIGFLDYKVNSKGQKELLCSHLIPSKTIFDILSEEEIQEYNFARYAVLTSLDGSQFVENSLVVQGCLPRAGVIRE